GLPEQLVFLDPCHPLFGGLFRGQILAPRDRLHAKGEADPRDGAAKPPEPEAADRLAGEAMPDPSLPSALAHKGMVLGDPPRRAEDESPSQLGGVLVA